MNAQSSTGARDAARPLWIIIVAVLGVLLLAAGCVVAGATWLLVSDGAPPEDAARASGP